MLTKSKFVRGMECPKKLWLSENHKELTIDKIDEQAVTEGKEVGKMAGKLSAERDTFMKEKEEYLESIQSKLRKLLFEEIALEDARKMYN